MGLISLEGTTVNFSGHVITNWSDDADALSIPTIDIAAVKRGADGGMVGASTGDKGGPVIIKLLANSPSTIFFMNALTAQLNGAAVTWGGFIRNAETGIFIALAGGLLTNGPLGPSLGKGEVSNAEFTFEFKSVIPDYSAASFKGV